MDRLKGKTILLGKEPGQGRLLLAIVGGKTAAIGSPNSVPNSVSRCKVVEGVAHAKINIDQNGNMILTNMKPQNVTFVNGSEIVSKRILPNNTVELGKDRFSINLPMLIETAKKLSSISRGSGGQNGNGEQNGNVGQGGNSGQGGNGDNKDLIKYNISHLERVWEEFHEKGLEIKKRQKEQGIYASLPMFFTMGGGAVTFVLSFILGDEYKAEIQILSGTLVVAGLIMLVYSFTRRKNDTSIEDMEQISEDFQLRYVCPNPDCNKFFGAISYKLLKNQLRSHKDQKMYCPRCGCELVEK